ncbi:hypothetical protein EV679_1433 [Kerstersia gyiorum]|uniref:Uncharacterized protein n=1 Tax=Kerstersia gyiorum TaxID=206506 RepID=A0A4Q7MST0_9BURK|nr:hypothetical protein [Kerstersia gyiorum]MCP1637066.1 hypothetical protein [Kerstersia gyiorum]MCP1670542.1 hypothetical protein [Kerstersia gyiorum]MCP1678804.1 hypothetical protein [Kerstersia gyiorum]MCP1683466.1 hypothetical protein [Kerstersia gyiorum]
MAKKQHVPSTMNFIVPKAKGTQASIISSKRCFSSLIYSLWARQRNGRWPFIFLEISCQLELAAQAMAFLIAVPPLYELPH